MSEGTAKRAFASTVEWSPPFDTILRRHLPLSDGPVPPDAILADLGLDSLATVSLVMELEDSFGVSIPDDVLVPDTFRTADALWQVITALLATAA